MSIQNMIPIRWREIFVRYATKKYRQSRLNLIEIFENRLNQKQIVISCVLLMVEFVLLLTLYWIEPTTRWSHLVFFDIPMLYNLPGILHLLYAIFESVTIYYYAVIMGQLYRCHDHQSDEYLYQIVVKNDRRFILNSTISIQVLLTYLRIVYRIIVTFGCFWFGFNYFSILFEIVLNYRWKSPVTLLLGILSATFFMLINFMAIKRLCKAMDYCFTHFSAVSLISFIRFHRINQLLDSPPIQFTQLRMVKFRRLHLHSMRYHFRIYKVYSKLIWSFLLASLPLNSVLVMLQLMGRIKPEQRFHTAVMTLAEIVIFIGIHIVASIFTWMIHGRLKRLISLNLRTRTCRIDSRIQIAHFIQTFHSKKHYGITYGPFGLVSMATFLQGILFYGEILMYNYNFLKNS